MPRPQMGALAAEIYQQLAPLAKQDEALGWPLAHFIAAKALPAEDVESWARDSDGRPGWSAVVDLDRAPAVVLPWLGQLKGVIIPAGLSDAQQREWIRTAEGQRRGTVPALIKAGQRHLTGAKTVRVVERVGGDAYAMTVVTRTSETPDPDATLADLRSAKRIGIVLAHVVSDDPLWNEASREWTAANATWGAAAIADVQ